MSLCPTASLSLYLSVSPSPLFPLCTRHSMTHCFRPKKWFPALRCSVKLYLLSTFTALQNLTLLENPSSTRKELFRFWLGLNRPSHPYLLPIVSGPHPQVGFRAQMIVRVAPSNSPLWTRCFEHLIQLLPQGEHKDPIIRAGSSDQEGSVLIDLVQ